MGFSYLYRSIILLLLLFPHDERCMGQPPMRILFWNVENLFDYRTDSLTSNREYSATGSRRWNFHKYRQKLLNISKGIIASGEELYPALIGLCEVENDSVLIDLQRLTPLHQIRYGYFITASHDSRGINVALLYKRDQFKPIARQDHHIQMPAPSRPTRDILHITGIIANGDTLDVMVCHFPSRYGGEKESRAGRKAANEVLREVINNVNNSRSKPLILAMGDFNDYPSNNSISNTLGAIKPSETEVINNAIYTLMATISGHNRGSHKFEGAWGFLDHFFVNGHLLNQSSLPFVEAWSEVRLPFMLTKDTRYFGDRPKRTYHGFKHEGGYSDHLPIRIDIVWQ